jgi:hypothetical protein
MCKLDLPHPGVPLSLPYHSSPGRCCCGSSIASEILQMDVDSSVSNQAKVCQMSRDLRDPKSAFQVIGFERHWYPIYLSHSKSQNFTWLSTVLRPLVQLIPQVPCLSDLLCTPNTIPKMSVGSNTYDQTIVSPPYRCILSTQFSNSLRRLV